MKNKNVLALILVFALAQMGMCPAVKKLGRGVEGLITAPMEYLNEYMMAHETQGVIASLTSSLVMGTAMTGKRIINAAYDIFAFPVPYPKPYRILLKDASETALQDYKSLQNTPK